MPSTTWSTTDLLNATLSSTNLMATATGAGGIRAAVGQTTGKYYFEFTPNLFNSGNNGFGIANASATLSSMGGTPTNAVMVYRVGGPIWINNVNTGSTIGNLESGWTFGIALDLDNYMIWIRRAPSGNWNGSGTANPATNTGGLSIASIASSSVAVFPAAAFGASSQRTTANFGLTPFCGAVPSGFIAGFPTSSLGPQVNSAWSTTDKTAPTLIQASNLGVIFGATAEGVRSAAYRNAGKFYFEIVGSSWFKPNTGIGVGNGGAVLTTVATTPTNAILVYSGGSIYSNGSIVSGAGLGGRSAGDTIAIALDLDNRLIWFRVAPSGNWNNSGTANPATGVGGISTGGLFGGASSAYALIATDAGADEDHVEGLAIDLPGEAGRARGVRHVERQRFRADAGEAREGRVGARSRDHPHAIGAVLAHELEADAARGADDEDAADGGHARSTFEPARGAGAPCSAVRPPGTSAA